MDSVAYLSLMISSQNWMPFLLDLCLSEYTPPTRSKNDFAWFLFFSSIGALVFLRSSRNAVWTHCWHSSYSRFIPITLIVRFRSIVCLVTSWTSWCNVLLWSTLFASFSILQTYFVCSFDFLIFLMCQQNSRSAFNYPAPLCVES